MIYFRQKNSKKRPSKIKDITTNVYCNKSLY